MNNAVKFASNDDQGLRFGSLYGFSNEADGYADNRLYGFGASYERGPLRLGAGLLEANNGGSVNTDGVVTLTDRIFIAARQRTDGGGANYTVGKATLGFVSTRTQLGCLDTVNGATSLGLPENGQGAGFSNYEVNASYRLTSALSLNGECTYTAGAISNASGEHHPKWHEVSVQADYPLSKRTDVYPQSRYQHVSADGSGLSADIRGQTPSSTNQQIVVAAGLRHRFCRDFRSLGRPRRSAGEPCLAVFARRVER